MEYNLLLQSLQAWDEKHTQYLQEICRQNSKHSEFVNHIIDIFCKENQLQHPTSWIIKYFVDSRQPIQQKQINRILQQLDTLEHWGSQLHILQIVPKVHLTKVVAKNIQTTVKKHMHSEKKFVKAAAYQAYYEIVQLQPQLKEEFLEICNEAVVRESASVQSKIKKIIAYLKISL
ncbi:MAG: hypothetical protein AAF518_19545 [Spirochaetota bacterium]